MRIGALKGTIAAPDKKGESRLVYGEIYPQRRALVIHQIKAGWAKHRLIFLAPAVSQAAACDETMITTATTGQKIAPGTLPNCWSKTLPNNQTNFFTLTRKRFNLAVATFIYLC